MEGNRRVRSPSLPNLPSDLIGREGHPRTIRDVLPLLVARDIDKGTSLGHVPQPSDPSGRREGPSSTDCVDGIRNEGFDFRSDRPSEPEREEDASSSDSSDAGMPVRTPCDEEKLRAYSVILVG